MLRSRMTGPARLGGPLIISALVLSGCGLLRPEDTAHREPAAPPPTPVAPPSTPEPEPERPFNIAMAERAPCDMLTADQRDQLGFDRGPVPAKDESFDARTCSYRNTSAKVGARLSAVTVEGMDVWTDDTAQVDTARTTVHGFPGLIIKTPGLDQSCNVAVDTADGQQLDVLYRDDGAQPPPPVDDLCAGAQRVADEAVNTLTSPPHKTTTQATPPHERESLATPATAR